MGQGIGITTAPSLPGATAGVAYTVTLHAAGGATPYTWSVAQGALPGGLILDSAAGTIAGTPTTPGTFNFTVQAVDAAKLSRSKS
ncbi:MAG: Ig domain-containing protein [Ignavibacteriota bacterium]